MLKYKRKRIYKKYNLDEHFIYICERIYKFNKKNGYYYAPSLRSGKKLIAKVLNEILQENRYVEDKNLARII